MGVYCTQFVDWKPILWRKLAADVVDDEKEENLHGYRADPYLLLYVCVPLRRPGDLGYVALDEAIWTISHCRSRKRAMQGGSLICPKWLPTCASVYRRMLS